MKVYQIPAILVAFPKLGIPCNTATKDITVVVMIGTAALANGTVIIGNAWFSPNQALGAIEPIVGSTQVRVETLWTGRGWFRDDPRFDSLGQRIATF